MIPALVEVTLLLALVWALDRLTVARLRPQVRHALWTLVAIRLLLPAGLPGVAPATVAIDAARIPGTASVAGSLSTAVILFFVWMFGAVILLARWTWQTRSAARRLECLDPEAHPDAAGLLADVQGIVMRVGLRRVPAVRVDPAADSPYVTGFRTPRLVLPAAWREWPEVALDHALAHELTHIARRDLVAEAVWMLIVCVYWFHPLAHLARRRAHEAREMCCDADAAARVGPGYRLTLLHVLAASAGEIIPARAVPSAHAWHPAIARLHALDRWPRPATRRHRAAGAALVLAAGLVVLPAHLSVAPHVAPLDAETLLDPATRQELGLGSLHLRYALLAAQRAGADDTPE